ncbi:polysaccharide deacetylase family protein [Asticcacaulis solisilvae]|uniref:polysaccharide deacetylase family protein n=1 Tax=Asticcacaulis solisilvae TaxID=1217274 RepID=UPI003FD82CB4
MAITFDDLPFAGDASLEEVSVRNRKVLDTLRRFNAPATGFVIEKTVEHYGRDAARGILNAWTEGGFSLGNHTYSHADTNNLDLAGIEREVADGEASIRPLMDAAGKPLRFVRFAMNHTGDPLDKSLAIEAMLRRRGYVPAASTIDTSDYAFEAAYAKALQAGDGNAAGRIADAYVAYSETEIDYYIALSQKVLGYEPPQIALLHLNRINADTLGRVLDLYVRRGFGFVTLEAAQADPAYAIPTTYATRFGPMWPYRWAKEKGVHIDGSLEQEPPSWIRDYARK